jgi:hypothetical protein
MLKAFNFSQKKLKFSYKLSEFQIMLASNTAPALLIFAASYALFRKFSASLANQDFTSMLHVQYQHMKRKMESQHEKVLGNEEASRCLKGKACDLP